MRRTATSVSRSNQIRISVLLALVAGAAVLLFASHEYHNAVLLRLAIYLITAIGVLAQLFWLIRQRLLWIGWVTLWLAFLSLQGWSRGEKFSAACCAAVAVFGVVQFFRELKSRGQFKNAQKWPLAKGTWGRNYEAGGQRLLCYIYQVSESYYSGKFVAGSTFTLGIKSRLDELQGKPIMVRYKLEKPEISTVFRADQNQL